MKKILLILYGFLLTGILIGQTPEKARKDYWIYKPSPGIYLEGSNAFIDFNDGDVILRQSTNTLTLSGGNLVINGSLGATGSRVTKGWFTNLEITNLPTINGASLSALYTSGNITLGTNSITMTGSLAATGSRVTKGWFTDIESTNLPTVGGVAIHTNALFTGNTGVGTTSTAYHKLSVIAAASTNLNALNITNSDINKIRTSAATASDTSSVNIKFTATGSPTLNIIGKTGNTLMKVDTVSTYVGNAITIVPNDTTVAKAYGRIVFKTSDSTLYVCKYIRPTGKKCWFKCDN